MILVRRASEWVTRQEGPVLMALLVLVLVAWGFTELAGEVIEGDAQTFDERMVVRLRRADDPAVPVGPAWLKEAALDITAMGGQTVLTLVVAVVAGYLLLQRKLNAMWLVLIASAGGWGLTAGLKSLFGRDRPSVVPHLVQEQSLSFPSGHAMMSAVVYLTLGVLLSRLVAGPVAKAYVFGVALLATLLVGVSRVYLGVHYPTDVLAGWAAGLAWALLCWLTARFLQRRGQVEPAEP